MYLALKKGLACEDAMQGNGSECEDAFDADRDSALIVSADTIVYAKDITIGDWCIMGKPKDEDDAWRMLSSIRGTSHYVVTGVCLIDVDSGDSAVISDTTTVWCKDYSDEDIYDYISREEPYDKAGSYAIQGYFGRYIDHIDGDYENVVGLPFYRIEPFIRDYL